MEALKSWQEAYEWVNRQTMGGKADVLGEKRHSQKEGYELANLTFVAPLQRENYAELSHNQLLDIWVVVPSKEEETVSFSYLVCDC